MSDLHVIESEDTNVSADIFIARQPIFRRNLQVHGFELVYRAGDEETPRDVEQSISTSRAIANAFLKIGADRLLSNKPAFITFDESMLAQGLAGLLPLRSVVVEVPAIISPSDDIIQACNSLKQQGFQLSVVSGPDPRATERWLPMADMVRINFEGEASSQVAQLAHRYKTGNRTLIASAVNTEEDFQTATTQGFDLFQGQFLARPTVVKGHAIAHRQMTLVRILSEVSKAEIDLDEIEKLIRQEVSLTYQLLRYMNSAAFSWRTTIKSVKHAIALLGEEDLRKWTCLLLVAGLSSGRPPAILVKSLAWARFGELLAPRMRMGHRKASAFLLGLFANLDSILKCPMKDAIEVLNLENDLADALLDRDSGDNRLRYLLALIRAYDSGDWVRMVSLAEYLNLGLENIARDYVRAVEWAEAVAAA